MEFGVLGDLLVEHGEASSTPSAPKLRQLLSVLLFNAGDYVSTDVCVEELWGERPPRRVIPTLQNYVMDLRKVLSRGHSTPLGYDRIKTCNGGYRIDIHKEEDIFDLWKFRDLVAQGSSAEDDENLSKSLGNALRVWRGTPIRNVQKGWRLMANAQAAREERTSVSEQYYAAQLRLGRHREVLSALITEVKFDPLNENMFELYMLTLSRSGRNAQALKAYHWMRDTLVSELGVEPSARVQRLNEAVLSMDPAVDFWSTPA